VFKYKTELEVLTKFFTYLLKRKASELFGTVRIPSPRKWRISPFFLVKGGGTKARPPGSSSPPPPPPPPPRPQWHTSGDVKGRILT